MINHIFTLKINNNGEPMRAEKLFWVKVSRLKFKNLRNYEEGGKFMPKENFAPFKLPSFN